MRWVAKDLAFVRVESAKREGVAKGTLVWMNFVSTVPRGKILRGTVDGFDPVAGAQDDESGTVDGFDPIGGAQDDESGTVGALDASRDGTV